ncbi:MAG: hypothetical protein RL693_2431 [Verrucomicrobiota bacterium]|jgi:hypothetical protein
MQEDLLVGVEATQNFHACTFSLARLTPLRVFSKI